MNIAIVIPSLNPPWKLVGYVTELLEKNLSPIIVVNDGSQKEYHSTFSEIRNLENCTVLTHETNKGKGRALKTAFSHILQHHPQVRGVVTADADGQHAVEDVCHIAEELAKCNDRLLLGSRNFDEPHVPKRSRLGNKSTSLLFQFLFKEKLNDTQTGLRGLSIDDLSWLENLKGERYEYEMNMLIHAIMNGRKIEEISIQTIYLNDNESSYYDTVKDSLRILRRILSGYFRKNTFYQLEHTKKEPVEDYGK